MEQIDVRCINCEAIVPIDEVVSHSKLCTQPVDILSSFPQKMEFDYFNFRFSQLCFGLERIKASMPAFESSNLLKSLLDTCKSLSVLKEVTPESLTSTLLAYNFIKNLKVHDSSSQVMSIYHERIKVSIKEQIKLINEGLDDEKKISKQSTKISEMLESKEKILNDLEKEIEGEKMKIKELEQSFEKISNISSFIENDKSYKSNHSRNSSLSSVGDSSIIEKSESFDMPGLNRNSSMNSLSYLEKIEEESEEDLKKLFYCKCLLMKLKYSSRHPAQLIQLPELYKRACLLNISKDHWDSFIIKQFNIAP